MSQAGKILSSSMSFWIGTTCWELATVLNIFSLIQTCVRWLRTGQTFSLTPMNFTIKTQKRWGSLNLCRYICIISYLLVWRESVAVATASAASIISGQEVSWRDRKICRHLLVPQPRLLPFQCWPWCDAELRQRLHPGTYLILIFSDWLKQNYTNLWLVDTKLC